MRNLWHVEFPVGNQVVKMDVAAPVGEERADVLLHMTAALASAGVKVDPFEATAELIGPDTTSERS